MKKFWAFLVVLAFAAVSASTAQAGRFGIKGAANLNDKDFQTAVPFGYQLGITWQWNLPLWFAIQPDLLYQVDAAKIEKDAVSALQVGSVVLPVNVQWGPRLANKNIRLFAQVSPYAEYKVSAKDGSNKININDIENKLSYGTGIGVGAQLWLFQVTAQYNWNLANFKKDAIGSMNLEQPDGARVTLALMFGKSKNKKNKTNNI
ncbi:MAG: outer membrane beta-barrel protein [Bacteroidales bacterium]|nr:outer membrane beta-barrel protein [Bacteroidales bacterium]